MIFRTRAVMAWLLVLAISLAALGLTLDTRSTVNTIVNCTDRQVCRQFVKRLVDELKPTELTLIIRRAVKDKGEGPKSNATEGGDDAPRTDAPGGDGTADPPAGAPDSPGGDSGDGGGGDPVDPPPEPDPPGPPPSDPDPPADPDPKPPPRPSPSVGGLPLDVPLVSECDLAPALCAR